MHFKSIFVSLVIWFTVILDTSMGQVTMQPGMKVAFKADNGMYLGRCEGCVIFGTTRDYAFVHVPSITSSTLWAIWEVVDAGQGKLAFKASDSGTFLSRCNNCGASSVNPQDSATLHTTSLTGNPQATWTPVYQNGKVSLQADTGNYLTRCTYCFYFGTSSDSAFVQNSNMNDARAQWTVEVIQEPPVPAKVTEEPKVKLTPGMKVAFKADNGNYLGRCQRCVENSLIGDMALVHESFLASWNTWEVVDAGNGKLGFKTDTGRFFTRCNQCAATNNGISQDTVSIHIDNLGASPQSQWTPVYYNSKVLFLGDTGNYLARCSNCYLSAGNSEAAFVNGKSKDDPRAQWTVEVIEDVNGQAKAIQEPPVPAKVIQEPPVPANVTEEPPVPEKVTEEPKVKLTPGMKVAFKASNGNYLSRCEQCVFDAKISDFAFVHASFLAGWNAWDVVDAGQGKIGLRADTQRFLSRCHHCAGSNELSNDSLTMHINDLEGNVQAQWTPIYHNGKVLLRADTGKFIALCVNCLKTAGQNNTAFVNAKSIGDPNAQWTMEVIKKS
jgi:hypothetical protein